LNKTAAKPQEDVEKVPLQVLPAKVVDAPKACGHPFTHKVCLSAWAPAFAGVTGKSIFIFFDSLLRFGDDFQ